MRMRLTHRLLVVFSLFVSVLGFTGSACANSKYAAFVVHAETGDILFDKYSKEKRYPASLTKMMTLYLLFEAIEDGDLKMTDRMYVSKRASLQPASRLGLAKGSSIDVETAIEALVIRSANDVATVVAEKLGGSETKFARMMTEKARKMGMRSTVFRNASGLPDRRQYTTARDIAILSQRISQDFPQFFHYFDQKSFTWKGRTYTSHNRVAMTLRGADGLKTGYTRASGYNLATSITRDDHHLIGVVLGGRSVKTRDAHMKQILEAAFVKIKRKPGVIKSVHNVRPVPSLKPGTEQPVPTILAAMASNAAVPVPTPKTLAIALPAEPPAPTTMAALDLDALQLAITDLDDGFVEEDVPPPVGEGDAEPLTNRDFAIQIGAYREEKLALARIKNLESTVRSVALIPGREVRISTGSRGTLYRARFTRLTEDEADTACKTLKAQKADCLVIRSE